MMVGNLLVGVVAYAGLLVAVTLAMNVTGRLAARALGIPEFRWFSESVTHAPVWKSMLVRGVAMLGPWLLSSALFWMSYLISGVPMPTAATRVDVLDGAAKLAGVQSGDRVVAIGGRRVSTWEQLRAAVPAAETPVAIELERDGRQLELQVTPKHGRLGVAPHVEVEHPGLFEAARRAAGMPGRVVVAAAHSLWSILTNRQQADLGGPIRIVSETSRSSLQGQLLEFLAILAAYLGAFAATVAPADALLSLIFRGRHRGHDLSARAYQLERARQAVLVSLVGFSVLFVGSLLTKVADPAIVLALLGQPLAITLFPAVWAGGRQVWKKSSLLLVIAASATIPCVVLLAGFDLLQTLRRAIRSEGFVVGWFRIAPDARPAAGFAQP